MIMSSVNLSSSNVLSPRPAIHFGLGKDKEDKEKAGKNSDNAHDDLITSDKAAVLSPFQTLPGETPPQATDVSAAGKRYVLQTVSTRPGRHGAIGEALPHPFFKLATTGTQASVLGTIYRDPKSDEYKLYVHREFRPSLGRDVISVQGGNIEAGEHPILAALREGGEESGGRFKHTSPVYMIPTPTVELPAVTDANHYLAVVMGKPRKPKKDTRDAAEKLLLDNKPLLGIPIKTLLNPSKLRRYVVEKQREIDDSNGASGAAIAPQIMLMAALLGDVIEKLVKDDKQKRREKR